MPWINISSTPLSAAPAVTREKSRAKERIFSFRDKFHQWDPKNQRPELWGISITPVCIRARASVYFRYRTGRSWISGKYIRLENIPIVPLYFAKERPCVEIDGNLIMADDDRLPEQYRTRSVCGGPFPYVGLLAADRRRGERGGYDRENRGGDDDHDEERAYDPCDRLRSRR